jgi:hypothetical protein
MSSGSANGISSDALPPLPALPKDSLPLNKDDRLRLLSTPITGPEQGISGGERGHEGIGECKGKYKGKSEVGGEDEVVDVWMNILGKLDFGPAKVNLRAHLEANIDASHLNHLNGKLTKLMSLLSLTTGKVTLHSCSSPSSSHTLMTEL